MGLSHELTRSPPKPSRQEREAVGVRTRSDEKKPSPDEVPKQEVGEAILIKDAASSKPSISDKSVEISDGKLDKKEDSGVSFKVFEKAKTLPNIKRELDHTLLAYEHLKSFYPLTGCLLGWTEVALKLSLACLAFILHSSPLVGFTEALIKKMSIFDEFICHQLDFIEERMAPSEKGSIYRSGGLVHRMSLLLRLSVRLAFIFPRLGFRMISSAIASVYDEIHEDTTLLWDVIDPPKIVRESARRKTTKPKAVSPGKKRKRETEVVVEGLPEYFYEPVSYCEEDDSDYVPEPDDLDEISTEDDDESEEDTEVDKVAADIESQKTLTETCPKSESDVITDTPISGLTIPLRL